MDKSIVLSVRGVSNQYISRDFALFGKKKIKRVLNNINLELRSGEIFGLTGNSGCGKTTLANCILGLIDYEGEIFIDGKKQKKKTERTTAKVAWSFKENKNPIITLCNSVFSVVFSLFLNNHNAPGAQMVFQEPGASLNPRKKIGWLLEEPLVIHRIGTKEERRQKTDEMLTSVGLDPSYKTRRVNELSGGQKQRVCIARALALNPRLLIADEAISSLDVSTGAQILNLFRELHKTLGLTILFISHNKDAVEYLCDRIEVMENGAII
ncbi:MAG: ATP-binding cassette domain-containing protein [Treponema sp.]|jgi:ABC-type dipeptide/oligopeptide/nickel transport system ATPase subunit|nr:ATP-binding cassette domain-containing protein [Treponema sp.]